jgi:hypothetical protein
MYTLMDPSDKSCYHLLPLFGDMIELVTGASWG